MALEFRLPDVGEGTDSAEIVEWHVAVGDTVREDQPLVDIETDKAVVGIPCPATGVVLELCASEGDTIDIGAVLAVFARPRATRRPPMPPSWRPRRARARTRRPRSRRRRPDRRKRPSRRRRQRLPRPPSAPAEPALAGGGCRRGSDRRGPPARVAGRAERGARERHRPRDRRRQRAVRRRPARRHRAVRRVHPGAATNGGHYAGRGGRSPAR